VTSNILLLGDVCIDLLMPVDMYPEHGGDGMAERLDTQVGGGVINSAISLVRLGVPAVPMVCTGADSWASYLLEKLVTAGLDVQFICARSGAATAITFVAVTPDGERTMFSMRGANSCYRPDDVSPDAFDNAGWLHLSSYALLDLPQRDALWRAVELARQREISISMDLNNDVIMRQPDEALRLLPLLNTCILGRPEVVWLGGNASFEGGLDRLLGFGVSLAAVKLGSDGCLLADGSSRLSFPPFPIKVVDTTGAGDAFSAGILYGCQKRLSLPAMAVLASALGALTTAVPGAGLAMPGKAEVLSFLRQQPIQSEGIPEVLSSLEEML
jgi:sugar/nucleoside kinase (ribokinase family)